MPKGRKPRPGEDSYYFGERFAQIPDYLLQKRRAALKYFMENERLELEQYSTKLLRKTHILDKRRTEVMRVFDKMKRQEAGKRPMTEVLEAAIEKVYKEYLRAGMTVNLQDYIYFSYPQEE